MQNSLAEIAGGDSGIGRAVAIHFAREGADVAILYKDEREHKDADEVVSLVEKEGRRCLKFAGDVRKKEVRKRCASWTYHNCILEVMFESMMIARKSTCTLCGASK